LAKLLATYLPFRIKKILMIKAAGIMTGTGNNMFSPTGSYTREQSITTMVRLFDYTQR